MELMLAKPYNKDKIPNFTALQPKLNGIRVYWDGLSLYSRYNNEFVSCPSLKKFLPKGIELDGELYNHSINFQKIVSKVRRSVNIIDDENIQFWAFDKPDRTKFFDDRIQEISSFANERLIITPTYKPLVADDNIINAYHKRFVNEGYEGTMIRNRFSFYEFKRTWNLMKLKTFYDLEVMIVEIIEGEGKYLGMLGAMIGVVENHEIIPPGTMVGIGTGFDDQQRKDYFNKSVIGKLATIKYIELTEAKVPKHPVFVEIRNYE